MRDLVEWLRARLHKMRTRSGLSDPTVLELETACPFCGHISHHLWVAGQASRPAAGSPGICAECRGIAVFDNDRTRLILREPTATERQRIAADPHIRRVLAAMDECYTTAEMVDLLRGRDRLGGRDRQRP